MSVCYECCVLAGRGLCDELITRPEESYRLWCVVVCYLETSWMRRPWHTWGWCAKEKKNIYDIFGRSQSPRGLRRKPAATRLLRLWVRISPGAWMHVFCGRYILSGRGLCDKPDHSSRGVLPSVIRRCVWSRNLVNEEARAHWGVGGWGCCARKKEINKNIWYSCVRRCFLLFLTISVCSENRTKQLSSPCPMCT
jgi:hypothetical protein